MLQQKKSNSKAKQTVRTARLIQIRLPKTFPEFHFKNAGNLNRAMKTLTKNKVKLCKTKT